MNRSFVGAIASAVLLFVPVSALAQSVVPGQAIATQTLPPTAAPNYLDSSVVEATVEGYFADIPVMIAIARCESKFRQFNDAGGPLDGGAGGMIGVFQINRAVHAAFANSLGFDIDSLMGNMQYARYLYEHQGTDPWIDSFPCWGSAVNNPEATSGPATSASTTISVASSASSAPAPTVASTLSPLTLTANLSFGMIDPQVVTLQQMLNKLGCTISPDGPGAPGQETNKFGSLTRAAVRRFQCDKGLVCSGDEGTSGYGFVGARTRAALLTAISVNAPAVQPASSTAVSTQTVSDKQARIATLQDQIAQTQKLLQDLQSQLAALQAS